MRELRILILLFVFVVPAVNVAQVGPGAAIHLVDPVAARCAPADVPCQDWLRFRRATTGPYQGFAVAAHATGATVILSEPPVPRAEFLALVDTTFGADLRSRSYRRWGTGLDSWLEDLVIDVRADTRSVAHVISGHDLAGWNAPASIVDRLLFIYAAIYGTTDGFSVDNVVAFAERPAVPAITEPTVAAADLLDWLTDSKRTWTDVTGAGAPVAFTALDGTRAAGVFTRSDGTLLALVVPAKTPLTDLEVPFRRFAVASDLLLGAYRSKRGATWIVGRARQMPLTDLPPLRFETLASFVRHRTTELVQSYERQRIFAGRVRSGSFAGWDWAPILLSSQLDDSEFGTLLNQADQILKSWSQAGKVDYYSFAHAAPPQFPFVKESASDYFMSRIGTTSLVFNWNTQSFSTIHQLPQGDLLSVDRLGALPVLYLPSGSVADLLQWSGSDARRRTLDARPSKVEALSRDAASQARRYFAERGDPILVRVAQNVLLYQVAQAFLGDVTAPSSAGKSARWETVAAILRDEATTWLRGVAAPGPTPGVSPAAEASLERAIRGSTFTVEQLAEAIATPQVSASRLAGLSAKVQGAAARLDGLTTTESAAFQSYRAAFRTFCSAVRGTMQTALPFGEASSAAECKYNPSNLPAAARERALVTEAEGRVKSLRADIASVETTLQSSRGALISAYDTWRRAEELSKLLAGGAALTAHLDRILARVRAGVEGEPVGTIRTAAVVLSRNTDDAGAIGGHNITFDPARVAVSPPPVVTVGRGRGRSGVTVTAPPRIRALDAGPAAEPVTALKTSRPATLLEAMRRAQGSPIDAAMAPGLARDAARSGVDAIIVRTDDAVFFARNTPPPVQRRLVGTTGIIEALGGPPAARTVRFDGFGDAPQLVESIVRSTELARKAEAPDSTRLSRFTDMAAKLFHGSATARSGTEATIFSHSRPGAQPAILRVANMRPEAVGPLMKQPVAWRAASVGVGEVKTLESGRNATSTYVRFSSGSVPASGQRLGIEVQTDAGRAPVSPQSLATATRTTLLQAGGGSTPLVDGLLLLRESIGRQLKPAEINFFIGDGATPVRITLRRLDPLWGQGL